MANDKIVQLPDGRVASFPGEMSDEAIAGAIRASLQTPEQNAPDANAQAKTYGAQGLNNAVAGQKFVDSMGQTPGNLPADLSQTPMAQFMGGIKQMGQGNFAAGAHQFLGALGTAAAPTLPLALAAAPLPMAAGLVAGTAGGMATRAGASAMGATPDQANLAGDIGGLAIGGLAGRVPGLAGKMKAEAGQGFQQVSAAAGGNLVDTTGPLAAAQRAKELQNAGFSMPRVINRFLARMNSGKPLTFDEARDFEQAAGGKLSVDEATRIKPQMYNQLSQFAGAMRKATMDAAGKSGQADTFSGALTQFREAVGREAMMNRLHDLAIKGIKIGAGSAIGGAAAGLGYDIYKIVHGDSSKGGK